MKKLLLAAAIAAVGCVQVELVAVTSSARDQKDSANARAAAQHQDTARTTSSTTDTAVSPPIDVSVIPK